MRRCPHTGAPAGVSTVSCRLIAPFALLQYQFEKARYRIIVIAEHLGHLPASLADPSPASHDCYFAKKGWPDRERVISGHVPVGVDPLAIKLVVVCSHPRMIGDARDLVQRDL